MSLPGRWRWCDRPWLCDARKEQNALHTLIHHRRLTPSCGGLAPTAERTMDPARIFTESLTPRPELENKPGLGLGALRLCRESAQSLVRIERIEWLRQRYDRRRHVQHPLDVFQGDHPTFDRHQRPARGVERSAAHFMKRPPAGDLETLRVALDRHRRAL